ncbi:MAG: hypothetical protein PHY45_14195 [Rhodocyclaceae bacterium]|nr:hypothetical protein [Rhodocyclaceae bacterium]
MQHGAQDSRHCAEGKVSLFYGGDKMTRRNNPAAFPPRRSSGGGKLLAAPAGDFHFALPAAEIEDFLRCHPLHLPNR